MLIGVDAFEDRPHPGGNRAFDIGIEAVADKQNPGRFNINLPGGIQKDTRIGLAIGKIAGVKLDREKIQNAHLGQMPLEAVFVDKSIGDDPEFQVHRTQGNQRLFEIRFGKGFLAERLIPDPVELLVLLVAESKAIAFAIAFEQFEGIKIITGQGGINQVQIQAE